MSKMGTKIDKFDFPVCNSFEAKIINDQLCYEVNPNDFYNDSESETEMNLGIALFIDYNEDRQFDVFESDSKQMPSETNNALIRPKDEEGNHMLYLGTIGKRKLTWSFFYNTTIICFFRTIETETER